MRNFHLLCALLVVVSVSEAGVIIPRDVSSKKNPPDGSGAGESQNPDFFGNNDGSSSEGDNFGESENPTGPPSDYEELNPEEKDYVVELDVGRSFNSGRPDIDSDDESDEDEDYARRNNDEEESDINRPIDEDIDRPFNGDVDEADSEEDFKIPFGERIPFGDWNPFGTWRPFGNWNHGKNEGPMGDDDKDPKGTGFFNRGSFLDSEFFNLRKLSDYFHQLEKTMITVFRQTMEEALLLNGTYANTTEEEVEIKGKKYIVQKSIIRGKDNSSTIYIEALSSVPKKKIT